MRKVSIIMTTYNCAGQLKKTLESVLRQDYPEMEIVIKDGMSTDGTVQVIKEYAGRPGVELKWSSGADQGIYDAMNQGYEMSSGDYLLFFNEIFLKADAVSKLVGAIEGEDCCGAHADLLYIEGGRVKRKWHMGQGRIEQGWMPGHPTLCLKREVYEKYGGYRTDYKCSADYEFMVRVLKGEKEKLAYLPEALVGMFYGGTSTAGAGSYLLSLKEAHKALKENGVRGAVLVDIRRTLRVLKQFLTAGRCPGIRLPWEMKELISVIIPVYNGEPYLKKCLDSIYTQTYANLEILVIDDGSRDGSSSLLKEYETVIAAQERRIRLYRQENQGVAAARNTGIRNARGSYIAFVDQDDFLEPDYLESLVVQAEEYEADIVVSGYCRTGEDGRIRKKVSLKETEWCKFMNIAPWGKLYRRNFILKNSLAFLNVIKGEDSFFSVVAYSRTEKIRTIPYVGYHWVDNAASVSNTVHASIAGDSGLLPLFEAMLPALAGQRKISREILEYYFLKSVIYELLYVSRGESKQAVEALYGQLFQWLDMHFPENKKNRNISFFRPAGERPFTRFAVKVFCMLRKAGLAKAFFRFYRLLP